jgi:hypothetical protein
MKRIIAEFVPQAWVRDYAIEVDPEGPTEWDVTETIIAMGRDEALAMVDDDYPSDNLRDSPDAPKWIRDWSGPFYVRIQNAIEEYFSEDTD